MFRELNELQHLNESIGNLQNIKQSLCQLLGKPYSRQHLQTYPLIKNQNQFLNILNNNQTKKCMIPNCKYPYCYACHNQYQCITPIDHDLNRVSKHVAHSYSGNPYYSPRWQYNGSRTYYPKVTVNTYTNRPITYNGYRSIPVDNYTRSLSRGTINNRVGSPGSYYEQARGMNRMNRVYCSNHDPYCHHYEYYA